MLQLPPTEYNHFSSDVRIELRVGEAVFEVASIGPNELILRESQDIEICDAEIVMFIDRTEFRWRVRLPQGAVPFASEVYFRPRGPVVSVGKR